MLASRTALSENDDVVLRASRPFLLGLRALRNLPSLLRLLPVRGGPTLRHIVRRRPEIVAYILYRYVAKNWSVRTRVSNVIQHCKIEDELFANSKINCDDVVDLQICNAINANYRVSLDRARWLLSEGLLVMSLWEGADRLYSISFSLAYENGERVAYVGGLQGRSECGALLRYRNFTKQAHGMRTRDFVIEVFKMFCRHIDVARIYAVSGENHSSKSEFVKEVGKRSLSNYDEVWKERNASDRGDGFLAVPVERSQRSAAEIPQKKRTMYRRRYAMLDDVEVSLGKALWDLFGGALEHLTPELGSIPPNRDYWAVSRDGIALAVQGMAA